MPQHVHLIKNALCLRGMYEHDIILEASKEFGMGISAEGSKDMVCVTTSTMILKYKINKNILKCNEIQDKCEQCRLIKSILVKIKTS
jgi:hypothetical protein